MALQTFTVFPATKGLVTSVPPHMIPPDALTTATNIEYDTGGIRKKRLGTARYNATAITGSTTVTALADFWRHGATLAPTQDFVCASGTRTFKDDGDGVWDEINAAWGTATNLNTNITIAQGFAVFSNGVDAPRTWDQTTEAALSGSPATFSYAAYHLRRLFIAGISATPSQVNFSAAGAIATWTGVDTGNVIFDEDDGDRVIGLSKPFHGSLYVFKGPTFGGVHELAGLSPSTFNRTKIVHGAPCVNHRTIVTTPNDIYWVSRYGIHSLSLSRQLGGDTEEAYLSTPIQDVFRAYDADDLGQAVGFWHPTRNVVGWAFTAAAGTTNTEMLLYNYVLKQWSRWVPSGFATASCMVALTPTTQVPRLYTGSYAGRVHAWDQTTLSDENAATAYTATAAGPEHYDLGKGAGAEREKQFVAVTTYFRPKNSSYNVTLDVSIDGATATSYTISMSPNLTTTYDVTPIEGRGRSIKLTYSQAGAAEDMEVYGYSIHFVSGEASSLERP